MTADGAMSIHQKKGWYVFYKGSPYGTESDREKARKHKLELGKTYTIEKIDIIASTVEVYLQEFPGIAFSNLLFDDAPRPPNPFLFKPITKLLV